MPNINIKISDDEFEGLKKFKKSLDKMINTQARVGVLGGNYPGTGESIASVAHLHEFGDPHPRTFKYKGKNITLEKGIPARSFLRAPILGHKSKIIIDKSFMKAYIIVSVMQNKPKRPIEFMATNAFAQVKEAFATRGFGKWLPNMNHEYIKLKGSTTPLIDTGLLRASVNYKIEEKD